MKNNGYRVLVVDDDPAITDFICLGLRYEGYEVETADSAQNAMKRMQIFNPHLIILDWMLPDYPGTYVCEQLRDMSSTGILMLTARDEVADRVKGLRSGADDYLVKPFVFDELLARIEAILRRKGPSISKNTLRFADLIMDLNIHVVKRDEMVINLTPTEFHLLKFFLNNPRRVLTRDNILDAVWGYDFDGDANIVEVYVGYLRRKLGNPPLISTVRGVGYMLQEMNGQNS